VNRQIRRLGLGLVVCYLALFAMINWVQVLKADEYADNPLNTAAIRRDFNRPRGTIETADGALLAASVDNPDASSEFDRLREYPEGELFAQVTGYFSFWFGSSGLERTYNAELAGQTLGQQVRGLTDLFVDNATVGNLRLSIRKDLQEIARDSLGDQEGSVVALDVETGEVLAFWSYPSYDPNALAGIDYDQVDAAWSALNADPANPMLAHQYQERYFPGSTFKVVTGGVGLQSGQVTATSPVYPEATGYTPPGTDLEISNFGGSTCGGNLFEILEVSCNSAFAQMGVDLGPETMVAGSEAFGFNDAPPIDLPAPRASSVFPTDFTRNLPKLAQSSIGQNDVQASPLAMAMVAAAVANEGRMMEPHLVREVRDNNQAVVSSYEPSVWREPLSAEHAATMAEAMVAVVEDGTARNLAIPGFEVGGKTGTAQLGTDPPRSHTWIIGFGGPPGDPKVAVATVVLDQPGASEFTGGAVAAPIARAVLEAALTTGGDG
jgi:peptidoglycan glycosyltransferase